MWHQNAHIVELFSVLTKAVLSCNNAAIKRAVLHDERLFELQRLELAELGLLRPSIFLHILSLALLEVLRAVDSHLALLIARDARLLLSLLLWRCATAHRAVFRLELVLEVMLASVEHGFRLLDGFAYLCRSGPVRWSPVLRRCRHEGEYVVVANIQIACDGAHTSSSSSFLDLN